MKTSFDDLKSLPNAALLHGMHLCTANSQNLFESAEILRQAGKFSPAISLLILSVEEIAKAVCLFVLIISDNREPLRKILEGSNLHQKRHKLLLVMSGMLKAIPQDGNVDTKIDLSKIVKETEKEFGNHLNWFVQANNFKNTGLYVDFEDGWVSPQVITESIFLEALKEIERIRLYINTRMNLLKYSTEEELEQWKEQVNLYLNQNIENCFSDISQFFD